jgi:protein transport protein SEC20
MDTAKQLVGALEKADWLDRLLILGAFTFFLLVVVWVVGQRTVGRGLRVVWWLTGGLRSSPSVKENIRKAAVEKAKEAVVQKARSAISETVSMLSVATSSIVSTASIVSVVKSSPPVVEVPEPSPIPTLGEYVGEEGKVSEVLESIVSPDPEPAPVAHDEL